MTGQSVNRFGPLAALVKDVQETEHKFLLHGGDEKRTSWMPYQPADFISIIWECLPQMAGKMFLDVGCGPGTKLQVASGLFGLDVRGIEIDPQMVLEARKRLGDRVIHADALNLPAGWNFSHFDLIWLYRPFRDPILETKLESRIVREMADGAILAGSGWETDPADLGWAPVVDDCLHSPYDPDVKIIRGAWQKPGFRRE